MDTEARERGRGGGSIVVAVIVMPLLRILSGEEGAMRRGDSEGGRERPEAAMKCPLRRNFGWGSSKSIPNLVVIPNPDSRYYFPSLT